MAPTVVGVCTGVLGTRFSGVGIGATVEIGAKVTAGSGADVGGGGKVGLAVGVKRSDIKGVSSGCSVGRLGTMNVLMP